MGEMGKLKERKSIYQIFSYKRIRQWEDYYGERLKFISEYIDKYRLYDKPFEVLKESRDYIMEEDGDYISARIGRSLIKAKFLCNNLEFVISSEECKVERRPIIPEYLFEIKE